MMTSLKYKEQVDLLLEVVEPVLDDNRLALKGGTAINLFTMDLPRLSVDLDLIYLPITSREEFLVDIEDVFQQMEKRLMKFSPEVIRTSEGIPKQMRLSKGKTKVKAEVNLVLRGTIYPPEEKELCRKAQTKFEKSVKILCASFEDQYAGKFCAALDRQHPRDLFDVKLFFENFSFTEKLKKAFLVYLITGNRPIYEIIRPNLLDQRRLFTEQFQGMTDEEATYEELVAARAHLIQTIEVTLTNDDRAFLLSLKKGTPEWELLGLDGVESLPGVRWKLMNIRKMDPKKHKEVIAKLEKKLSLQYS